MTRASPQIKRDYVISLAMACGVGDGRNKFEGDCMDHSQQKVTPLLIFLEAIAQKAGIDMEQYVGDPQVVIPGQIQTLEAARPMHVKEFEDFLANHQKRLEDIRTLLNRITDSPSRQDLEMAADILKDRNQWSRQSQNDADDLYRQIVTIDRNLNNRYGQLNQQREVVTIPNPQPVFDELNAVRTKLQERLNRAITPLQRRNTEIDQKVDELQCPLDTLPSP
jgi:hypothetical protein